MPKSKATSSISKSSPLASKTQGEARNKSELAIIFIEIVLLVLVVYQAYQIIKFKIAGGSLTVSFIEDPMQYLFFALAILLLVAITFTMKKKNPEFYEKHTRPYKTIKDAARKKILGAKEDHKIPALLLIEFIFVIAVVASIAVYLDPEVNIVPPGLMPAFPFNIIIFALVLFAVFWLYGYTGWFRMPKSE